MGPKTLEMFDFIILRNMSDALKLTEQWTPNENSLVKAKFSKKEVPA